MTALCLNLWILLSFTTFVLSLLDHNEFENSRHSIDSFNEEKNQRRKLAAASSVQSCTDKPCTQNEFEKVSLYKEYSFRTSYAETVEYYCLKPYVLALDNQKHSILDDRPYKCVEHCGFEDHPPCVVSNDGWEETTCNYENAHTIKQPHEKFDINYGHGNIKQVCAYCGYGIRYQTLETARYSVLGVIRFQDQH